MGVLIYDAKRNVISGHSAGSEYKIENAFQEALDSTKELGSEWRALGGPTEYELDRIDDLVVIRSDLVLQADYLLWKEFQTSVQAREQFSIDLTGTIAVPGTIQNCVVEKPAGFRPSRTQQGVQIYTFSFTVRIV